MEIRHRQSSKYDNEHEHGHSDDTSSSTTSEEGEQSKIYERLYFRDEQDIDRQASARTHSSLKLVVLGFLVIVTEIMFQEDIFEYELTVMNNLRDKYDYDYVLEYICRLVIFFTDLHTIQMF